MMKIIGIGLLTFLLMRLARKLYEKLWAGKLDVRLEFADKSLFEGEKGELLEIIENGKRLPLPMLKVKFQTDRNLRFTDSDSAKVTDMYYRNDIFQVKGRERITRKLEFTAAKRGYYRIHNIDLVAGDPLLSSEMVESRQTAQYFYVYPAPFVSEEFRRSLQQLNGELLTKLHFPEDPFEYRGVREYQPFDDMRSINWKASAKTGDWKVNQKNCTALQTVRLFFNIEDSGILKKDAMVEASIQIIAGLAAFFLNQGIRVSCYGNGRDILNGEPVHIEAGAGAGQMEQIYRALARIDTNLKTADFTSCFERELMKASSGITTVFVSPNAYENFTGLLRRFRLSGQECLWFYPVPETEKQMPELPEEWKKDIRILHIAQR